MNPVETTASDDWSDAYNSVSPALAAQVAALVAQHKADMAQVFYRVMTQHPQAAAFLSPTVVETRLKPGIERWMAQLFSTDPELRSDTPALQRRVGQVHARAEIPVALVARGFRVLKAEITLRLMATGLEREALVQAVVYVDQLLDQALADMTAAYQRLHDQDARTDEVFRMVAASQNLALEREKQLGALTEWENRFLRALATVAPMQSVSALRGSAFGLWLNHKAPLLFSEAAELPQLDALVGRVDQVLQSGRLGASWGMRRLGSDALPKAHQVLDHLAEIRFLLSTLVDRMLDLEVGKDALTQLYNRRFLPTILRREVELARRKGTAFCVLMLDIDHFKNVNDGHGHEVGDRVLQQVAALITAQVRASDFVFRYGGEEFLVVLVELSQEQAVQVAEKIRRKVETTEVVLQGDQPNLSVTLSAGVACHNGHPDYHQLVNRADQALYAAKHGGRNRVHEDTA